MLGWDHCKPVFLGVVVRCAIWIRLSTYFKNYQPNAKNQLNLGVVVRCAINLRLSGYFLILLII